MDQRISTLHEPSEQPIDKVPEYFESFYADDGLMEDIDQVHFQNKNIDE